MVNDIFNKMCSKYNLSIEDKKYLEKIVLPIISNSNFVERTTNKFPHHGSITLGEHILEDTIVTYLLSKKKKSKNYSIELAIKIALLHDLYTIPWQNNKEANVDHFWDKHGFRHPVEAIINSIIWYPELFHDDDESQIIIDGVLHHMFPLPVRSLKENTIIKNRDVYNTLDTKYQEMIKSSLNRKKIGGISFARSKYIEGKIMAKADRKVSRKQIRDLSSLLSLVTGNNRKLNK